MRIKAPALSVSALMLAAVVATATMTAAGEVPYNPATVAGVSGVITAVSEPPAGQATENVHVTLRTNSGPMEVYLAPRTFLSFLKVNFAVGDQIDVIGSNIKMGNVSAILAREVLDGRTAVQFRDALGAEVWKHWGTVLTKVS
jgi:hypothetical protein